MTLYHFTSARHLAQIETTRSISQGTIPWKFVDDKPTFLRRWQWLTQNPDFDQSWDRGRHRIKNLPYRRTEYRVGIAIPDAARGRIIKFSDFCQKMKPESEEFLKTETDWQNWYLFSGPIPKAWFVSSDRNPTPINLELA